ncbi:MAG: EamA family transporter [Acetobacteraceae bacterium]
MNSLVFAAVLAAAGMHAGWNALVKARLEPLVALTMITLAGGVVAVPALIAFGLPRSAALPNVGASTVLHLLYYFALAAAYRYGEMSQVYPIARGSGPLFATGAVLLIGERVAAHTLVGIVLLAGGVILMSLQRVRARNRADLAAIGFALATGLIIAGYTVVDGFGARRSGNPGGYVATLCVLDALPLPLFMLWRRGAAAFRPMRGYLVQGIGGGALSVGAYGIALWAMTQASIPAVAALRETSVLFSTVIATFALKERFVPIRGAGAVVIFVGIVMIRLG